MPVTKEHSLYFRFKEGISDRAIIYRVGEEVCAVGCANRSLLLNQPVVGSDIQYCTQVKNKALLWVGSFRG